MHIAIEKSTIGLELTFTENGVEIPAAAISSLTWELLSQKTGYTNPVLSGTGPVAANPHVVVMDLTNVTVDDEGARLLFDAKFVYDSAVLGNGAIGRITPVEIRLIPKKMST